MLLHYTLYGRPDRLGIFTALSPNLVGRHAHMPPWPGLVARRPGDPGGLRASRFPHPGTAMPRSRRKRAGRFLCLGGVDQDGVGDQAGKDAVELVEASGRVDGPAGL